MTSLHSPIVRRFARAALALLLGLGAAYSTAEAQPQAGSGLPNPRLFILTPPGGKVGSAVEVTFTGTDIEEPEQLIFSHPGLKAEPIMPPEPPADPKKKPDPKKPAPGKGKKQVVTRFKVTIAPNVPVGIYDVRLVNQWGVSNPRAFVVGDQTEVQEKEPNNDVEQAQRVEINSTINGSMANPTDVDYYAFTGKKGQRVVFSCLASAIDSRFHAGLEVYDSKGQQLASSRDYDDRDALTDCTLPDDGDYQVRVFQFTHTQGTPEHFYRLTITTAPWIDAVFPCVVEPGKATSVTVYGRNLPGGKVDPTALENGRALEKMTATVTAPSDAAAGQRLAFNGHIAPPAAGLDGFEYRVKNESGSSNPFLITLARAPVVLDNGTNKTLETAQEVPLPCEVAGQVEKTRDRDWYSFTAKKGDVYTIEVISQRLGAPALMYFMLRNDKTDIKESDDNPDVLNRKFFMRSDDPQPFRFVVPADGKYFLLVGSRLGDTVAGPRHFYRVRIAPEQPDFRLVAMGPGTYRPDAALLYQGGQQNFSVFAIRQDGFVGDIALSIEGLPAGVTATPQTIGGDVRETMFVVSAAATAGPWTGEVTIKGTATIRGQKVVREARPATIVWPVQQGQNIPTISRLDKSLLLAVRPKAPFTAIASIDKATLTQGEKGTIKVKVTRLWPEFKTPLNVQPQQLELPKGLTVNNNQPINIAPNAAEGSLAVNVPTNVQPGTYTIVFRCQGQVPYNKDPMAKQKPNVNIVQPSTPVTLTVLPKSVANVTLSNQSLNVKLGKEAEVVVRVARQFGYEGEFKVQVVLPANAKGVQIADAVIPAGKDEAKLVVKTVAGAAPVNLPNLVVRATADYQGHPTVHEVKLNVNVTK
jgi:hypothetical protein